MNTWRVILPTLVIFGAGVITGALAVNLSARVAEKPVVPQPVPAHVQVERREQQQQTDLLHRMDKQLALTPAQHTALEKVLKDSQKRTKVIRDHISPQLKDEVERLRREISTELTPEQQKKFESLPHTGNLLNPRKPEKSDEDRPPRKKGGEKKKMTTNSAPSADGNVNAARVPVSTTEPTKQ